MLENFFTILFRMYIVTLNCFQKFAIEEDTDSSDDEEISVFPREFGERFMLQLHDFRMKLQINLKEEGIPNNKNCNVRI